MTLTEDHRKDLIAYRINQSHQAVEDVEFLIDNQKYNIAINRIYYGIFYALSALALKYEYETSKHQQLIGWFNKTFVKAGIISVEKSSIVHKSFNKRSKGDYAVYISFSEEEVVEMFKEMKSFLKEINKLLSK
jgi:uncharacterized protein (UPF0332 family)